jgi:hypothetical protein
MAGNSFSFDQSDTVKVFITRNTEIEKNTRCRQY